MAVCSSDASVVAISSLLIAELWAFVPYSYVQICTALVHTIDQ